MHYDWNNEPWKCYSVDVDTLSDRNASVAAVKFNDSHHANDYAVTASAKREPGDQYDSGVGEQLAVGRALEQLGRELQKAAWESVNA